LFANNGQFEDAKKQTKRAEAKASARISKILQFESGQQPSGDFAERFCAWADSSRFESARWLKTNSIGWRREKSHYRFGAVGPGRKLNPKAALRDCSAQFSRRWPVVFCSGL
jgi:hypothetical protein